MKKILIIVIVLLALLLMVSGWRHLNQGAPAEQDIATEEPTQAPATEEPEIKAESEAEEAKEEAVEARPTPIPTIPPEDVPSMTIEDEYEIEVVEGGAGGLL